MFWYRQGDGGSLLTAIFMTIAERGTKCQSFQKGFSRFWLKICGICEPTNEREKSLACLCFSEQEGGRQSQICVKFKTKEYEKGNLEIYYSDHSGHSDGYCHHLWCYQLYGPRSTLKKRRERSSEMVASLVIERSGQTI